MIFRIRHVLIRKFVRLILGRSIGVSTNNPSVKEERYLLMSSGKKMPIVMHWLWPLFGKLKGPVEWSKSLTGISILYPKRLQSRSTFVNKNSNKNSWSKTIPVRENELFEQIHSCSHLSFHFFFFCLWNLIVIFLNWSHYKWDELQFSLYTYTFIYFN